MSKTLLVMRQEIYKTLRSPGYVIFAFVVPVLAVVILAAVTLVRERNGDGSTAVAANAPSQATIAVEGYVDQSGLIRTIPADIPADRLRGYVDEAQAQRALAAGEITAYYVIPPDFMQSGRAFYVFPDTRSYLDDGQPWVMDRTLMLNLLGGDAKLADWAWSPTWNVTTTNITASGTGQRGEDCSRPGAACKSNDLVRYIPALMVAIFFAAFMVSSSRLFNTIGIEKENRTLEVLLLAISPRQFLAGKTLGLGAMGILQTLAWLSAVYIASALGGSTLRLPEGFVFPAEILVWGVVLFVGGYGLYASLMAGAGALVPRMKEAGVANVIVMIPLFVGYMVGLMAPLSDSANAALPIALSFFPLTAPVVMMMRLSNGAVPLWQLLLASGLIYTAAWWALRAVADMFHAQNLLSGQAFSVKRYLDALFVGRQEEGRAV